ncbi:DUF3667 domain-containing protein [Oxalobacteraceae bacterium OM1]|nr:DUF3667 domain-containing protein [Oxalobacteraceae bacterium OM1]
MTTTDALPAHCPNCAAAVVGPYCAHCGQRVIVEPPTLWAFIHEYVHHYMALEGKLMRSLWLLVRHPGRLSREYMAGRRACYVTPLQLYLTVSFVFFLLLHFAHPLATHRVEGARHPQVQQAGGTAARPGLQPATGADAVRALHDPLRWLDNRLAKREAELDRDPDAAVRMISRSIERNAPYAAFLIVPAVAALLQLLYRRRQLRYGMHLVFALHIQSFVFLLFVATLAVPAAQLLVPAVLFAYLVPALREAYGGRLPPHALRAGVLVGAGMAAVLATMVALPLAALLV